jgi:hypothetical protein
MSKQHLNSCPACGSTGFQHLCDITDHYYSKEIFRIEECRNCGLRFTQDRPDAENISAYYDSGNYASHDSQRKTSLFQKIYNIARDWMLNHKYQLVRQFKPEWKQVLDYGTGEGFFVEFLQRKGIDAQGIEPSDMARKNFSKRTGKELYSSVESLPAGLTFQAISLWHVLEHIHELRTTMEQLCARLENKGIMVIAVPNQQSKDAQSFGSNWAAWDVPRHLYHWDDKSLGTFMNSLGLKKIYTSQLPLDPFYIGLISARYAGKNPVEGIWCGLQSYFHGKQNHTEGSTLLTVWMKDH